MSMLKFVVAYVTAACAFITLDMAWLTNMTGTLYRPVLGPILTNEPRIVPVIIFYALFVAGIVWFAIAPAFADGGRWAMVALNGALFGFIAYGTYDLTNHATLSVWSTKISIVDMAWGAFATACASVVGYFASGWFAERF